MVVRAKEMGQAVNPLVFWNCSTFEERRRRAGGDNI